MKESNARPTGLRRYGSAQIGPEFGQIPATMSAVRPFPGECCFQVIYFVANIFSSPLAERVWRPRVETIRLTCAVKYGWQTGVFTGFGPP
jgi:hypothetical protein